MYTFLTRVASAMDALEGGSSRRTLLRMVKTGTPGTAAAARFTLGSCVAKKKWCLFSAPITALMHLSASIGSRCPQLRLLKRRRMSFTPRRSSPSCSTSCITHGVVTGNGDNSQLREESCQL